MITDKHKLFIHRGKNLRGSGPILNTQIQEQEANIQPSLKIQQFLPLKITNIKINTLTPKLN